MSIPRRAGAACLVVGPLVGFVSMLVTRTVSLKAADQAAAFTAHPGQTQLALALNALAAVLLAAGLVWLAWTVHQRAPRLAVAGAVVGVLGLFAIMFDDAVHVSGSIVVNGLSAGAATSVLHGLTTGGVTAVGPLSELADLGVILLAVAALQIDVPRWAAAVLCAGVVVQGAGFGAGSRYAAAVGFALAFVGFATVVRTVFAGKPSPVRAPAMQRV